MAAPSAAPTISEVQERMGQIETFIASGLQASAVPGRRRGVVVARPETAPYLYFLASRDDALAAIELKLQHAR